MTIAFLFSGNAFADEEYYEWEARSGSYALEARFVRIDEDHVVLLKRSGEEISVPLDKLSEKSVSLAQSEIRNLVVHGRWTERC